MTGKNKVKIRTAVVTPPSVHFAASLTLNKMAKCDFCLVLGVKTVNCKFIDFVY